MDLSTLPKEELQEEFLKINYKYISITGGNVKTTWMTLYFLKSEKNYGMYYTNFKGEGGIGQFSHLSQHVYSYHSIFLS